MMKWILVFAAVLHVASCTKPLFLSPYIAANRLSEGRNMAAVDPDLFLGVSSFSGLITVNLTTESNLFFWFFPAHGTEQLFNDTANHSDKPTNQRPIVLWLNGGPSQSSLMGLFTQNGPFLMGEDQQSLNANPNSWHRHFSMLYIDQPVGTGFSYTSSDSGFCRNMSEVADQLYLFLEQFFQLFPMLQSSPFFIAGESFAGKYIPAIAHKIVTTSPQPVQMRLQGLAMGNAMTDPRNMLNYSEFAYQLGFIDDREKQQMQVLEEAARNADPRDFFRLSQQVIGFFQQKTQTDVSVYNVARSMVDLYPFVEFVDQNQTKAALHVPGFNFNPVNETVRKRLELDFGTSAMPWLEKLLDSGLRVMYFIGNMDFIVGYPLSVNAFRRMKWSGAEDYLRAERDAFLVNGTLAGFIKRAKNFAEVVVLNAGHSVPVDQPIAALELMERFVADQL